MINSIGVTVGEKEIKVARMQQGGLIKQIFTMIQIAYGRRQNIVWGRMLWAEMQSGAKCLLEFLKAGQKSGYAKFLVGLRE